MGAKGARNSYPKGAIWDRIKVWFLAQLQQVTAIKVIFDNGHYPKSLNKSVTNVILTKF